MKTPGSSDTVDAYFATLPPKTQTVMAELRALVHETVPDVTERISYNIPTFDHAGRVLIHIAAWQRHVSLYPVTEPMAARIGDAVTPYLRGKGTAQFQLSKPIPADLIRAILRDRVAFPRDT